MTIPEMIARAEKRVQSISSEIASTKRRLVALERELVRAKEGVEIARNKPRKTAIGAALHQAEKEAAQSIKIKGGTMLCPRPVHEWGLLQRVRLEDAPGYYACVLARRGGTGLFLCGNALRLVRRS